MKKLFLFLGIISLTTLNFISCNSDDVSDRSSITPDALPSAAKTFVSGYFSNAAIKSATQSTVPNIHNSMYKAFLSNGFEIDFDKNGNWTEIESENDQAISESFLSEEIPEIYNYVKSNYPSNRIVAIEKEHYGYSVELNNDIDLIFNQNQEFAGIDPDDNDNETIISYTALPQNAQEFVSSAFVNAQYVVVKKEVEHGITTYKAYLSTGYKVEFNASGSWTEVEGKANSAIPSTIIPYPIQTYVSNNHAGYNISSIEKEIYGYKIEVVKGSIDIDLKFDSEGSFMGVDD
ncbi:MAG: PepSY-like domain-containing protein [Flavobacteriaceae bacterium]|jgi:hypothetical protein|nr:PepSY-like domain-containing protein [Flavobacteriaceae bacterium]